jgi:hypothetical protein
MTAWVLGRGEGQNRFTARGSVMFFKAVAEQDGAGLHDLWNRAEAPTPDQERALMARFGMEPA